MKKILNATMIFVLVMTLATGTAFAADGTTEQGNIVPVFLTVPAIGDGDGGIDFTITDRITMTATAGSTVLEISDMIITNEAATGQLRLDSIEAEAETGWTIKSGSSEYFAELKADTKEFSLVSEGNDFAENAKKEYGDTKLVAPGQGSCTIEFTGHIGTFINAVSDTKVAEIVATVSPY